MRPVWPFFHKKGLKVRKFSKFIRKRSIFNWKVRNFALIGSWDLRQWICFKIECLKTWAVGCIYGSPCKLSVNPKLSCGGNSAARYQSNDNQEKAWNLGFFAGVLISPVLSQNMGHGLSPKRGVIWVYLKKVLVSVFHEINFSKKKLRLCPRTFLQGIYNSDPKAFFHGTSLEGPST